MARKVETYRVYGTDGLNSFDEYCDATSPQVAVDLVREWHSFDDVEKKYEVVEVARVVSDWK